MTDQTPTTTGTQRYLNNWTSLFGVAVLMVALAGGIVLFVADLLQGPQVQYLVLAYLVTSTGLVFGFVLTLIGFLRSRGRAKRGLPIRAPFLLRLDLENPRHRNMGIGVVFAGLVAVGLTGAASIQTLDYVSSNEFCTQACHSVMAPEGTAHQNSPHAKVDCVKCHVGSDAESFAASKARGLGQVWALITDDVHRPIPAPVDSMQPARETCEQCHWKRRWVGFKEKVYTYYSSEDDNAASQLRLLMKVGGAKSGLLEGEGIHFHMTLGRTVEFIARDRKRQEIAWVRVTDSKGEVREFASSSSPLTAEEKETLPVRQMDCMDCHNRPAHQFKTPMESMNTRMAAGHIDTKIPGIKLKGVEVLSEKYETGAEAQEKIAAALRTFYEEEYPDFFQDNRSMVDAAVTVIQEIYAQNSFPEMKASAAAYPDNLGHRDWPGCFRCHNDDLEDGDGDFIFTNCTKCHIVLAQGADVLGAQSEEQVFFHIADDEKLTDYTECIECHDAGAGPY